LVSEIFDLKVADKQTNKQTDRQNSTLSDYKGRLKLSAREPTDGEVMSKIKVACFFLGHGVYPTCIHIEKL